MAPPNQSKRRHAYCKIYVNGKDVTAKIDPHLNTVTVVDNNGPQDTCSIDLDDRDGRLEIPVDNVPIQIWLGWQGSGPDIIPEPKGPVIGRDSELGWEAVEALVFQGYVHGVVSAFSRGGSGGRRLTIEGIGGNVYDDLKTNMFKTWGPGEQTDTNGDAFGVVSGGIDGKTGDPFSGAEALSGQVSGISGGSTGGTGMIPFSTVITDLAKSAGYTDVQIDPRVGGIVRDYWQANGPIMSEMQRLARELGAQLKILGKTIAINPGNNYRNWAQPVVEAWWGINLISWRIMPYSGIPQYKGGASVWFDSVNAMFRKTSRNFNGDVPFNRVLSMVGFPNMAPNRLVGDQSLNRPDREVNADRGTGWCIINGDPNARAGRNLQIVGARQGVDGSYLIDQAEHKYLRGGGYTTRCQLIRPQLDGPMPNAFGLPRM